MIIPEFFVQTEYNTGAKEGKKIKLLLFLSYGLKVLSLGFIVLTAIFSVWWYLFGFGGLYSVGIFIRQMVLQRTEAYEYFLVRDKLKISVRNNFHTQKQLAVINLADIKSIEQLKDVKPEKDEIFAAPEGKSIIKIRFIENGTTKNMYFKPSRYMLALIQKRRAL